MREQAAKEIELAIASCNLRMSKEEAKIATMSEADAELQAKDTADIKDMVTEMKQRLTDLRQPSMALGAPGALGSEEDALRGVLGKMLGESKADQAKRLQEATQNANHLSGMVKEKKPKAAEPVVEGKGKRKVKDASEDATNATANGKKVKFTEQTNTR